MENNKFWFVKTFKKFKKIKLQNQMVGSLNVLTKDISTLKQQYKKTTVQNPEKPAPQKRVMQVKEELDRKRPKFFVKVFKN